VFTDLVINQTLASRLAADLRWSLNDSLWLPSLRDPGLVCNPVQPDFCQGTLEIDNRYCVSSSMQSHTRCHLHGCMVACS
jgi:hypothetical protein